MRWIIRVELRNPVSFINDDQIYDVIVVAHAFVIIFFCSLRGFWNWLTFIILKAPDIAFPRINNSFEIIHVWKII